MRYTIFLATLVMLFGLTSLWLAGVPPRLEAASILFGFAWLSVWTGQLCLNQIVKLNAMNGLGPGCFAIGAVLNSAVLSVVVTFVGMPLWVSAASCSAIVVWLWIWLRPDELSTKPVEEFALVVFAAALLLVLHSPISSPTMLAQTGQLPIWSDYYIHGVTIYNFSSPLLQGQDMTSIGFDRVFYHYGPFMLSALMQSAIGASGLTMSTAVLLPMGLLIAMMGGVALALYLEGMSTAFVAFLALLAIPGPEAFGIHSGWFDFDWLLIAAPGSGYAIGFACVLLMIAHHIAKADPPKIHLWRVVLFLAVGCSALILTRVQMFVLLAPVLPAYIGLTWSRSIRNLGLILVSIGVSGAALVVAFSENVRSAWLEFSQPHIYLARALNWSRDFGGLKAYLVDLSFSSKLFLELCIVLGTTLGVWTLLWPVLIMVCGWKRTLNRFDMVVPIILLSYIVLILVAPAGGNGDLSEYKHRHFLLLYVLVVISSAYLSIRLIPSERVRRGIVVASGLAILGFAITMTGQMFDRPDGDAVPWAGNYHNAPITLGVPEVAAFLASQSRYGDVYAVSSVRAKTSLGAIPEIISLAGVPSYLGRADLHTLRSDCYAETVTARIAVLEQVASSDTWETAREVLRAQGIRWYVRFANDPMRWPSDSNVASFSSPVVFVYDSDATYLPENLDTDC